MSRKERNKIIARFDDLEWDYEDDHDLWIEWSGFGSPESDLLVKYHDDYNWLMSVVEKIEKMGFGVHQYKHSCSITQDSEPRWSIKYTANSKLGATYEAVFDFIEAFNEGKF